MFFLLIVELDIYNSYPSAFAWSLPGEVCEKWYSMGLFYGFKMKKGKINIYKLLKNVSSVQKLERNSFIFEYVGP